MRWRKTIKIKHLFTEDEDYESLQYSMNLIANELERHTEFECLLEEFRNLAKQKTLAVANDILNDMYDVADSNGIWIE